MMFGLTVDVFGYSINFWLYHWLLIAGVYFATYTLYAVTQDETKEGPLYALFGCLTWPLVAIFTILVKVFEKPRSRYVLGFSENNFEYRLIVVNEKKDYIKIPVDGTLAVNDEDEIVYFSYRTTDRPNDVEYRRIWATNYIEYLRRKVDLLDMPFETVSVSQLAAVLDSHHHGHLTHQTLAFIKPLKN